MKKDMRVDISQTVHIRAYAFLGRPNNKKKPESFVPNNLPPISTQETESNTFRFILDFLIHCTIPRISCQLGAIGWIVVESVVPIPKGYLTLTDEYCVLVIVWPYRYGRFGAIGIKSTCPACKESQPPWIHHTQDQKQLFLYNLNTYLKFVIGLSVNIWSLERYDVATKPNKTSNIK